MKLIINEREVGYDESGAGAALLLLHAFPLDRTIFHPQHSGLQDRANVISFDFPGVGESEGPVRNLEHVADVAVGILDALNIDQAVIAGVSMGGYATFEFLRRHPKRVRGLILSDTKPAADTGQAKSGRHEMMAIAREKGAAEIANRMLPKLLGETTRSTRPGVAERVRAIIESLDPESIAGLLLAMAGRADSTDRLSEITVPALVITGEEDMLMTPADSAAWAAKIPNVETCVIAGAGHLPNLETPQSFNSAVAEFLARL